MMLSSGSKGSAVVCLQQSLNYLKTTNPPLVVDGVFGPKTLAAVKAFQKGANLTVDGIVGPMTNQTLVAAVLMSLMGAGGGRAA